MHTKLSQYINDSKSQKAWYVLFYWISEAETHMVTLVNGYDNIGLLTAGVSYYIEIYVVFM